MTSASAEKAANIILGAAAIAAAIVVLRTPALRRLAWNLTRTAVVTSMPAWIGREVQQAWAESDRRAP